MLMLCLNFESFFILPDMSYKDISIYQFFHTQSFLILFAICNIKPYKAILQHLTALQTLFSFAMPFAICHTSFIPDNQITRTSHRTARRDLILLKQASEVCQPFSSQLYTTFILQVLKYFESKKFLIFLSRQWCTEVLQE